MPQGVGKISAQPSCRQATVTERAAFATKSVNCTVYSELDWPVPALKDPSYISVATYEAT